MWGAQSDAKATCLIERAFCNDRWSEDDEKALTLALNNVGAQAFARGSIKKHDALADQVINFTMQLGDRRYGTVCAFRPNEHDFRAKLEQVNTAMRGVLRNSVLGVPLYAAAHVVTL